jgi:large-conductance mechanosensitive channel
MFLVVKAYNRMRKEAEDVVEEPSEEVLLLREIRDGVRSSS